MDSLEHVGILDDRRDYRDDLLHVAASILATHGITSDKEIEKAIDTADRLIRRVDRFVLRPPSGCEQRHVHETGEGS